MPKHRQKKIHSGTRRRYKGQLRRRVDTRNEPRMARYLHFLNRLEERYGIYMTVEELVELHRKLDLQWDGETHINIKGQIVPVGVRDGTLTTVFPPGPRPRR